MGTAENAEVQASPKDSTPAAAERVESKISQFAADELKQIKKKSCHQRVCIEAIYVILALTLFIVSIAVIVVTITTAIATKVYSSEQSGRLVAMITIAVTAGIGMSMTIYGVVGVFQKHKKPIHATAVVLVIIAIIQAVICGVSVKVSPNDEENLMKSLTDSFKLALVENPRHMKIWATTNHNLKCCGLYSPDDYRLPSDPAMLPPNVPISCCPYYNPDRSLLVQERERAMCKARRVFYANGCAPLVLEVLRDTTTMVLSVTILLIILEILLTILGFVLYKHFKIFKNLKRREAEEPVPS